MSHAESILEAGGLVPAKTKVAKESTVDQISARIYRHAALGDRPVVRLSADGLAQGDDLAMEFLGFEAPEVDGPVALRRRQALGFPGWALINDPEHARYALELVKEFRKEARRAKSKPGHAYDAFVDIAKRLDRSVAHFLPSYWEEVGREFMQAGNSTYASRAFGKAREAEKVHSLDVDESLRQDAFLEFALAGCLSNKALTEYGKDLQQNHEPAEAWDFFRELCVRRTLGGMPPWTSMTKELGQLIKSAGLDVDAELERLLKEIIESPAMNRAAMGFWKTSSKIIKSLAAKDDHVAGVLLNLMPETSYWDNGNVWKWLDFLDEWELLENAWKDGVSEAAGPRDGAAKWLKRLTELDQNPPQRLHDLVRKMADRLHSDGEPVNLVTKRYSQIHVDLLDLALELKIPIADAKKGATFDLSTWASPEEDAVDRPRDPVHVYADKRFRKLLEEAVPGAAGGSSFEKVAHGKNALDEARKAWLLGEIASIDTGSLPKASDVLDRLAEKTSRVTFQEFPEAYKALKKIDLLPVLQRNIQAGVIDEYGWPVLEEAIGQLNLKKDEELKIFGEAPNVIVSDGLKMLVVGPTEILLEHEIQAKKKQTLCDAMYLDGELLVILETDSWDNVMYWSSNPKKTIKLGYYYQRDRDGFVVRLESGGSFTGQKTVHAGDEKEPGYSEFFYDGEHFWRHGWFNDEMETREISPNGDVGRKSMPAFLEDFVGDGKVLNQGACSLMSLGDWVNSSPLGGANGCVGWRVRYRPSVEKDEDGDEVESQSEHECEGIDGRSWKGHLGAGGGTVPDGLISWPGTDRPLPFCGTSSYRYSGTELWDAEGANLVAELNGDSMYNQGQVAMLSPSFWHAFQVRDARSSKKLRSISQKQTKTLLDAAVTDLTDIDEDEVDGLPELPATIATVNKWLTGLKSERLGRGLQGVFYFAAGLHGQLEELLDSRDPEGTDADGGSSSLPDHLATVYNFFSGEREPGPIASPEDTWFEQLLGNPVVQLLRECWVKEGNVSEETLDQLTIIADLGFPDLPGSFRHYEAEFSKKPPIAVGKKLNSKDEYPAWQLYRYKGNHFILWRRYDWQDEVQVFEYAPKGKYQILPGSEIDDVTEFHQTMSSDQMRAYIDAFRNCEDSPWAENEALQTAADQIGVTRAEVALVWCGMPNFSAWESNFIPKPVRVRLGLKVKEAEVARKAIRDLKQEIQDELQTSLISGPPEDLWEDGGQRALDRLVQYWAGSAPKRLDVSADVLKSLNDATGYESATECINALADPKKHPRLKANAKWTVGVPPKDDRVYRYRELGVMSDDDETFAPNMLKVVTLAVPLFYSELPGGSDAARNAVVARDLALKCLGKPGLLFHLAEQYYWGEDSKGKARATLKTLLGKTKKQGDIHTGDNGVIVGAANDSEVSLGFRPAKVKSSADIKKLHNTLSVLYEKDEDGEPDIQLLPSVDLIRSDAFAAICKRIGEMAEGPYDSNPLQSAPKVVKQVAKKHKLEEDSAVLYLQLLALHDPTTANLKRWNDWTPARIKKAAAPLLKKKLILEAKRARAGRNYFLPGGWEALKIPFLPIETWKLPLYDLERNAVTGQLEVPLCRILPLRLLGEIFAAAWKRTLDGDAPGYEEVK